MLLFMFVMVGGSGDNGKLDMPVVVPVGASNVGGT